MNPLISNAVNFYIVTPESAGQRLDNWLIKVLKGVPVSHIYQLIRTGELRVNKHRTAAQYKLVLEDRIRIPPMRIAQKSINSPIPYQEFAILYEDEYFLIIDKPAGIACHGGSGISFGIIEQLRAHTNYAFLELVHRLDKDTSGVLMLAKKRLALIALQELIKHNLVQKEYLALCQGILPQQQYIITAPLHKYHNLKGEIVVGVNQQLGKTATSIFTVEQYFTQCTLVRVLLKTGRTHQIRVHAQYIKHPIAGDSKYGDFGYNASLYKCGLKRMFLHAAKISFIHPLTTQEIFVKCNLPPGLQRFLQVTPVFL